MDQFLNWLNQSSLKIFMVLSIPLTIYMVFYIRFKMKDKHRSLVLILLYLFSFLVVSKFSYDMYKEINFTDVKNDRYQLVIKKLEDIRESQRAHKTIKGVFQNNWDNLVKFIENDSFTITQRRDSSIVDEILTKRYGGVKTFKDIVIVDTLGFISVKDSLFGNDSRYKDMMYVPFAEDETTKFVLNSGFINQNNIEIPVFEVKVKKSVILYDQPQDLILKENDVKSVDGVNGPEIRIGSMTEVNDNGNWPKNYSK